MDAHTDIDYPKRTGNPWKSMDVNGKQGKSISAPLLEPDMAGYIVPCMESPISPSTNMEAAFGRLHHNGAGAFGACSTVVESIMVDGETGGAIYGTKYPSISSSKNGAENDHRVHQQIREFGPSHFTWLRCCPIMRSTVLAQRTNELTNFSMAFVSRFLNL